MVALRTRVWRFLTGCDAPEQAGSGTYGDARIPPALRLPMIPTKHGRNPVVSRVKQRPPPPEPILTPEMIAAGVRNGRRNGEHVPWEDDDTSR